MKFTFKIEKLENDEQLEVNIALNGEDKRLLAAFVTTLQLHPGIEEFLRDGLKLKRLYDQKGSAKFQAEA